MSHVLPAVPLRGPIDCTSWGPGHLAHPVQVKLAFEHDGDRGSVHLTPDGVVFVTEHHARVPIASHHTSDLVDAVAVHGADGWRLSHSLLVKGHVVLSVADGFPMGLCVPRRARNPLVAFRVGQPRSGGPVRRQRWLCSLSWGCDSSRDGTTGWAGGLAAKLLDLSSRGGHLVRVFALDGRTRWLVHVDGDVVQAVLLGSRPETVPLAGVREVAELVRDSIARDVGGPTRGNRTIEIEVTAMPVFSDRLWAGCDRTDGAIECSLDGSLAAWRPDPDPHDAPGPPRTEWGDGQVDRDDPTGP